MTDQAIDNYQYRSRELVADDYIQTLLNSLTLDQIRDAAYLLAPTEKIVIRNHAGSREGLSKTHRSNQEIVAQLLRVEASQPFKHCLFFKCKSEPGLDILQNKVGADYVKNGVRFRCAEFIDKNKELILIFEHTVPVKEWVRDGDDERRRVSTIETRHPVVYRYIKKSNIGTFNFPGFSQGQATRREKQISYEDVLKSLLNIISDWGFDPAILAVRDSLRILLSGGNKRVHRFRADFESAGVGRFDLASSSRDVTVEDSLIRFLKLDVSKEVENKLIESIRKGLNSADANSVVLYWQLEKIITRLKFWDIGCEIYFVWTGTQPRYEIVDQITELLAGLYEKAGVFVNHQDVVPIQWIAAMAECDIRQPSHLAEALGLSPGQARDEFIVAVKLGLVQAVYRLKTKEIIPELPDIWTSRISDLRQVFRTNNGHVIDGRDPSEIEVAFQRVGKFSGGGN
jgi:hypothetical protein